MTRVVLDTRAVAKFTHHLDVVSRALLEALRLDELVRSTQLLEAIPQFVLDEIDGREQVLARRHVVRLRVYRDARQIAQHLAGQRIEHRDLLDLVVEELDAHGLRVGFRRENVDDIAPDPVGAAMEVDVVALVLQFREPAQQLALIDGVSAVDVQHHLEVGARVAQTVDR